MALPDFGVVVSLFARLGRGLSRLVLGVLDNPGPDPVAELEEAEELAREAATEAREAVLEWVEGAGPEYYSEGVRGASGDPERLSAEQERSRELAIEEAAESLLAATTNMERDAKRQLRRIARRRAEDALSPKAGSGVRKEIAAFRAELEELGIAVVDKAGRRQRPEVFAESALRAITADIQNTGHLDAAAMIGAPGVLVLDNEGPNSCQECHEANQERWGIGYARLNKIAHPRCVRSFSSLSPSYSGELNRE